VAKQERRLGSERKETGAELTFRERAVLAQVLEGKTNKEIACELRCSARTVQFHVSNILWKTRHTSRLRLVVAMGRR
jgi:DNA-binding NarL/FixJ family response regulator